MKVYHRLSLVEREAIGVLYHCGAGVREIARQLYRSPSTISRELNRSKSGFYYLAVAVDNKARRRCYRRSGKLSKDKGLRWIVINGLRKQWSPAQISAKLKLDYPGDERMRVCAETIHTYLYVLPRGVCVNPCCVVCGSIDQRGGPAAGALTGGVGSQR